MDCKVEGFMCTLEEGGEVDILGNDTGTQF